MEQQGQATVAGAVALEKPPTEAIMGMSLTELGLGQVIEEQVYSEWRQRTVGGPARRTPSYQLKVQMIIGSIGPLSWSPTKLHVQAPSCLRRFADKLLALGLTTADWPLRAQSVPGVLQAHIDRAGGEKSRLIELPMVVLNMSPVTIAGISSHLRHHRDIGIQFSDCAENVLWGKWTIRHLLQITPKDFLRASGQEKSALIGARRRLRELGFDEDDGPLIAVGSRRIFYARLATRLESILGERPSEDKVDALMGVFREETFELYDE